MDARDQVRCRGRCCVAQANARDVGLVGVEVGAGGQRGAAREGCREELALVGAPGKAQPQVITPAGVIGEDVCSQGLDDRADRHRLRCVSAVCNRARDRMWITVPSVSSGTKGFTGGMPSSR